MADRADLLILGGGLAGLSIAKRLARHPTGGRVIVLEPRKNYVDDRSWAFWAPVGSPWATAAATTWTQWRFGLQGGPTVTAKATGWCYALVRGLDVYDTAREAIASNPRITLALGVQAGEVRQVHGGLAVETSAGSFHARHVIDTRPPDPGRIAGSLLLQSFYGREVALADPVDASVAEVMTDMRCDAKGFLFSYVLPLSERRVLVEVTRFARVPYGAPALAPDLDALLESRGWSSATVLREEQAVLPMGLPDRPRGIGVPGVIAAGISAGALRAASGYGFLRIQAWADRCADALAKGTTPVAHPPEPRLRAWMDAVFLRALARHPERMPEFFLRLAGRVPPVTLVRFLSDRAGLLDVLQVMAALPPGPFLRAVPPSTSCRSEAA